MGQVRGTGKENSACVCDGEEDGGGGWGWMGGCTIYLCTEELSG